MLLMYSNFKFHNHKTELPIFLFLFYFFFFFLYDKKIKSNLTLAVANFFSDILKLHFFNYEIAFSHSNLYLKILLNNNFFLFF